MSPVDIGRRLDAVRLGHGAVLLASEWGPPSGVVVLHWYDRLDAARPAAQIDWLLVGQDCRRRGLARLLVKAAAQAARVAGCGTLEVVAPADSDLTAFCEATGFSPCGHRFARTLRKNTP